MQKLLISSSLTALLLHLFVFIQKSLFKIIILLLILRLLNSWNRLVTAHNIISSSLKLVLHLDIRHTTSHLLLLLNLLYLLLQSKLVVLISLLLGRALITPHTILSFQLLG